MPGDAHSSRDESAKIPTGLKQVVAKYEKPTLWRGVWQMADTLLPYGALWYFMFLSLDFSYLLTAGLALMAAGLLVRVFIIFHDCVHGSFFKSRRANDIVGFITGVLTFTPFYQWRWEHMLHHASAANLDRRGTGDVWTLTVQEYVHAPLWNRFAYRLARNPSFLFVLAPLLLFGIKQRFPSPKARRRERNSVHWTNLGLLAMMVGMGFLFGFKTYLLLQLGILMVAGAAGVWLFYVQHQFEGVWWERGDKWDYYTAALKGSSFYKLPKLLQWFSGNIGFHHIHHLNPRIPNYNLEKCQMANPIFETVKPITPLSSLKSLSYRLWDEKQRKLVGFSVVKSELRGFRCFTRLRSRLLDVLRGRGLRP